jgi:general secretion pathway protein B
LGGKTGPATAAPVSSGSTLQVSGIAWQKDSADRLAVINGIPLVIGDIIEGAQVREILPDRVRFATKEKSFEIFLGKSAKVN